MSSAHDEDALATLTPEEREAFESTDISEADAEAMRTIAGETNGDEGEHDDDEGDEDASPVEGEGAQPEGHETDDGRTASSDEPAAGKPLQAEARGDQQPVEQQRLEPAYRADLPQDFDDRLKAVGEKETELWQKFEDGDISSTELQASLRQITNERAQLDQIRTKAEIAREMQEQTAQREWASAVKRFMDAVKRSEGIDYRADADRNRVLDGQIKLLAADPANENREMDWFLSAAHRATSAILGVPAKAAEARATPGNAADAAREASGRRRPPAEAVPPSLSQVPGGDGPGDVSGEFADLDGLEGDALESAISRMTPAQREKFARGR